MQLKSFTTRDGNEITLSPITVLIGPNNAGKSHTLRELMAAIGTIHDNGLLVRHVTISEPSTVEMMVKEFNLVEKETYFEFTSPDDIGGVTQVNTSAITQAFQQGDASNALRLSGLPRWAVQLLNAEQRFPITQTCEQTNLHQVPLSPKNYMQQLQVRQDEVEPELSRIIHSMFGLDLRLDSSSGVHLELRVAREFPPPSTPVPYAAQMREVPLVSNQGHGIRSVIGIVLPVLLEHGKVLLIDEPEVFLHGEQARQLGSWLGLHCKSGRNQIILATHNEHLLQGMLESGAEMSVVRLNRTEDHTSFLNVDSSLVSALTQSPLLSGQSVLHALFQRAAVLVEAPNDRAVYQSVARSFPNSNAVVFVHAQNKQTIPEIADLLRRSGVPVAAIVDFDAILDLREFLSLINAFDLSPEIATQLQRRIMDAFAEYNKEGSGLEALRKAGDFLSDPETRSSAERHGGGWLRNRLRDALEGVGQWDSLKGRGVDSLHGDSRLAADELIAYCATAGFFLVPIGELESWFSESKGKAAISRILDRISAEKDLVLISQFVQHILHYLSGAISV